MSNKTKSHFDITDRTVFWDVLLEKANSIKDIDNNFLWLLKQKPKHTPIKQININIPEFGNRVGLTDSTYYGINLDIDICYIIGELRNSNIFETIVGFYDCKFNPHCLTYPIFKNHILPWNSKT